MQVGGGIALLSYLPGLVWDTAGPLLLIAGLQPPVMDAHVRSN